MDEEKEATIIYLDEMIDGGSGEETTEIENFDNRDLAAVMERLSIAPYNITIEISNQFEESGVIGYVISVNGRSSFNLLCNPETDEGKMVIALLSSTLDSESGTEDMVDLWTILIWAVDDTLEIIDANECATNAVQNGSYTYNSIEYAVDLDSLYLTITY